MRFYLTSEAVPVCGVVHSTWGTNLLCGWGGSER